MSTTAASVGEHVAAPSAESPLDDGQQASGQQPPASGRPERETAVVLENLGKRFAAGAPVLDDVNATIGQGEFVALLGASGCGKSTLLNIIAGLEPPSTGALEVPSEGAAFMFQDSALFPWISARGNVELALKLRGVGKAERRARAMELLELVHLGEAADKRPHELSGGMRQRVSLARALAQDRPLLLMDEPFAALDAITRDLLHDELERIWKETGRTIIFVTHNVREAVRLGQRVLLLSSRPGRVVAQWEVSEEHRTNAGKAGELTGAITSRLREEIRRHA
ncbi:ABC transporter ATP-binding protein [Pseudarthrobacter sp. P1]|uniref:ABC transporter ATP-binding protein n=1 Tax=Pseudarthrobacter sp. P1 TaxID=3418418 RepID=UPI003CEEEE86